MRFKMNEKDAMKYWQGWAHFLGKEGMSPTQIRNWLIAFRNNIEDYAKWDDATIKDTVSKLKIDNKRYPEFAQHFKLFIEKRKLPGGMTLVLDSLNKLINSEFNIHHARAEIAKQAKQKPKRTPPTKGVKAILHKARQNTIFDDHTELFDEHVIYTVHGMWLEVFAEDALMRVKKRSGPNKEILAIMKERSSRTKFHQAIIKKWKAEYKAVKNPTYDKHFKVKKHFTLHQKYIGHKINTENGWLDMSQTGVGKTDACLNGVAQADLKNVVIFCPHNIVYQWAEFIDQAYPDADIITRKEVLDPDVKFIKGHKSFYICSYALMSLPVGRTIISKLLKQPVDFIVFDEVQNVKIRDKRDPSIRRVTTEQFVKDCRTQRKVKVAFMSATPVVNNLQEGKSLIEMLAGKRFPHLKTESKFQNAAAMHTEILKRSTRFLTNYDFNLVEKHITVDERLNIPKCKLIMNGKPMLSWLDLEKISIEKKIDAIINDIKEHRKLPKGKLGGCGKTIIYTEYVSGIIEFLGEKLKEEFGEDDVCFFTGTDKAGIEEDVFFNEANILIASTPVAEGLDKLQLYCNHLIFAGYPWTYAKQQQIIGRLMRTGQTKRNVHVTYTYSVLNGLEFDREVKINRITFKKTFGDCVVDGELPEIAQLPKGKARTYLLKKMAEPQQKNRYALIEKNWSPSEIKAWVRIKNLEKRIKDAEKGKKK